MLAVAKDYLSNEERHFVTPIRLKLSWSPTNQRAAYKGAIPRVADEDLLPFL